MNHLAVLGTSSHVGKSVVVAALCRIFADEGLRVAPFKAQNMALNAYVTRAGEEIGYAQALQAQAARLEPSVHMNPILIKPEPEHKSQLIVQGRVHGTLLASHYRGTRETLYQIACESFDELHRHYDLIVMEGAGSPVELNLMDGDLSNLRLPRYANASLVLVGDIDRGGVFASLYGTARLLPDEDRQRLQGLIVNKFRGDPRLFDDGRTMLEEITGLPVLGVVPFEDFKLPEEDSVSIPQTGHQWRESTVRVLVVVYPYISNFTDLTVLEREPALSVAWLRKPPVERPDLIILPGSKATMADVKWLRETGWFEAIKRWMDEGVPIIGICGGFQMLGEWVLDPDGVEGMEPKAPGLGLIPAVTVMKRLKQTVRREAQVIASGWEKATVIGYEIHQGETTIKGEFSPFIQGDGWVDGYIARDGKVIGTYLHGIFDGEEFRRALLAKWGMLSQAGPDPVDEGLNRLGEVVRQHVGIETLYRLVGL